MIKPSLCESFFKVSLIEIGFKEKMLVKTRLLIGFKYGGYNTNTLGESNGNDFLLTFNEIV